MFKVSDISWYTFEVRLKLLLLPPPWLLIGPAQLLRQRKTVVFFYCMMKSKQQDHLHHNCNLEGTSCLHSWTCNLTDKRWRHQVQDGQLGENEEKEWAGCCILNHELSSPKAISPRASEFIYDIILKLFLRWKFSFDKETVFQSMLE